MKDVKRDEKVAQLRALASELGYRVEEEIWLSNSYLDNPLSETAIIPMKLSEEEIPAYIIAATSKAAKWCLDKDKKLNLAYFYGYEADTVGKLFNLYQLGLIPFVIPEILYNKSCRMFIDIHFAQPLDVTWNGIKLKLIKGE